MRISALRPEFTLPGAALLGATVWLVRVLHAPGDPGRVLPKGWAHSVSSGAALLVLALALGASYVIGALLVQLTYDLIAKHMRNYQRALLLALPATCPLLRLLVSEGHLTQEQATAARAIESPERRQRMQWIPKSVVATGDGWQAVAMLIELGRSCATSDVIREVEYRRSNRQVFLGVIPALLIGGIAAAVMLISAGPAETIVGALAPLVALLCSYQLLKGAWYQEERGEELLMHAAISRCLDTRAAGPGPTVKSEPTAAEPASPASLLS